MRQAVSSDIDEGRKSSKRAVSLLLHALRLEEFQMCLDLFYTQMSLSSVGFTELGSGPCWLFHVSWCLLSLFLLCKSQSISCSSAWCHEWNQVNKIIFEGQEARQALSVSEMKSRKSWEEWSPHVRVQSCTPLHVSQNPADPWKCRACSWRCSMNVNVKASTTFSSVDRHCV